MRRLADPRPATGAERDRGSPQEEQERREESSALRHPRDHPPWRERVVIVVVVMVGEGGSELRKGSQSGKPHQKPKAIMGKEEEEEKINPKKKNAVSAVNRQTAGSWLTKQG